MPTTRSENKRNQEKDATKRHRKEALSLGSQLKLDKSERLSRNTSKDAYNSHETDKTNGDVKKRKRTGQDDDDSNSEHDPESIPTFQYHLKQSKKHHAKQPRIRVSSKGSSISASDDEKNTPREDERTVSDVKSDNSSVIPGCDFERTKGLRYLTEFLQRQSIPITTAKTLSGLKLYVQDRDQAKKSSKNVVNWIKSEEKRSGSVGLWIPHAAKDKPCTIFAVQTVSGDSMNEREKEILEKAAISHNIENSLTLVLYYRADESLPYKLSAGILASTGIVYMIDGPESGFADQFIGILATQKSPSWVVS